MRKQLVNPATLYDGSPFGLSHGTVDKESRLLFVSGQVAWDLEHKVIESTVVGQFNAALSNLRAVLAEAGSRSGR